MLGFVRHFDGIGYLITDVRPDRQVNFVRRQNILGRCEQDGSSEVDQFYGPADAPDNMPPGVASPDIEAVMIYEGRPAFRHTKHVPEFSDKGYGSNGRNRDGNNSN